MHYIRTLILRQAEPEREGITSHAIELDEAFGRARAVFLSSLSHETSGSDGTAVIQKETAHGEILPTRTCAAVFQSPSVTRGVSYGEFSVMAQTLPLMRQKDVFRGLVETARVQRNTLYG